METGRIRVVTPIPLEQTKVVGGKLRLGKEGSKNADKLHDHVMLL